jgi:hypothetical protein
MTGVMTHELGHILGLHHEHVRADPATAGCAVYEMRNRTTWDSASIMGYRRPGAAAPSAAATR